MNRYGRISILVLVAAAGILVMVGLLAFTREGVATVGSRFMTALSTRDIDTLTKMTYLSGKSEEEIRKEWDFALNTAGKHYLFRWQILTATQADADNGSVRMYVVRNAASPGAYEEVFALPLTRQEGQWKVDVRGINRDMFPALPR
jgi:hypothetical protein